MPKDSVQTLALMALSPSAQLKIILSGMTYYDHWYSLDSRIERKFIELCLAIRITFVLKKIIVVVCQMTKIRSITSLFITYDQVVGLPDHVIR